MTNFTQEHRFLSVETSLKPDALLVQDFTGSEAISTLFSFHVNLLSEQAAIPLASMIGKSVTLALELADGTPRYLHGIVSRFGQSGRDARFTYYHAEVVPWLWLLTRRVDCRVFQDKTIPEILTDVFDELKKDYPQLVNYRDALTPGMYTKLDYCVQYRETDFNFVSRLMEQEGIFYFFEHERGKHTLVLADSSGAHQECPDQPTARYLPEGGEGDAEDTVTSWQMEQQLRSGKYTLRDFHFQMPSKSLEVTEPTGTEVASNTRLEIYDFPGEYAQRFVQPEQRLERVEPEGRTFAKWRMQEEEASHVTITGASACRAFTAGTRFGLTLHSDQMDGDYVLTSVQHAAVQCPDYVSDAVTAEPYTNQFTCVPHRVPFRPPRVTPKPIVQGPQTAVVVGKAGEEIWTDKYGRVKVQFPWDRKGKFNENSSCWVRVSHPWAGKNWGSVSIPRIGQEVLVDFLEGDPDQPIITGRVYNAEQMPPYGLPAGGVVSGIKSNSTKGGGGYNEISMDDTKKKEKITVHAQHDMSTTVEHDDSQTVHNNRTITVDGTHTETIKKDTKITISEGTYKHDVAAKTAEYHVKAALKETYEDTQTTTVTKTLKIDGKANILIQAADEIKLQVGAHFISIKKNGEITISSDKIAATAGTEAKMGVGNQNVTCDRQKVATSGAAINSSAVGMHEITGAVVKIN